MTLLALTLFMMTLLAPTLFMMTLLAPTVCNSNTALSDDDLAALCMGLTRLEALDTRQCFLLTEHALELAAALTSLTACMGNGCGLGRSPMRKTLLRLLYGRVIRTAYTWES
jgi:hypothetical protein